MIGLLACLAVIAALVHYMFDETIHDLMYTASDEAYEEGMDAFDAGLTEDDCQYDLDSPEGEAWLDGFWEAEAESQD